MAMRVWDEIVGTITWEWEFFSGILFSNNFEFFYQMISFLTLIWMHGDGRCGWKFIYGILFSDNYTFFC